MRLLEPDPESALSPPFPADQRLRRSFTRLSARKQRLQQIRPRGVLELLRERGASADERLFLQQVRGESGVCWDSADHIDAEPLVTVRIATFNRGPLVAERAIASALAQSYKNLEILVIGDACDDATATAVQNVNDERVRFLNLPVRGHYPERPRDRWMVAGAHPMNVALAVARGQWIAPCDDDDEFTVTHIEHLLDFACRRRSEFVWSRAALRTSRGGWTVTGAPPLEAGHISHGSVLYSLRLRFFLHSTSSWRIPEPSDWNLWRRMQSAGVKMDFLDEITYYHY